jgi:hypothetical protein
MKIKFFYISIVKKFVEKLHSSRLTKLIIELK